MVYITQWLTKPLMQWSIIDATLYVDIVTAVAVLAGRMLGRPHE